MCCTCGLQGCLNVIACKLATRPSPTFDLVTHPAGASNHEDLPGGAQLVDWDLDGFLSDRQRPLLTESTLAAMPEGLRKRTALQRIFYLAYQMDASGGGGGGQSLGDRRGCAA